MPQDLRVMDLDDLRTTMEWARQEGWNPGLDDAEAFWATDPGGYWVGSVDGEPASSVSVVRYGDDFAFLGLYIVSPQYRGQGLGVEVWDHALATLPPSVTVGLDGVPDQQHNYRKSGFVLAHRNARWGGTISALPSPSPAVRPLGPDDLAQVAAYEVGLFPAPRNEFLARWLEPGGTRRAEGYVEGGRLRGYGVVRQCHDGWKVGPLFADGPEIAEALITALVAPIAPGPVFLDVPEPNASAVGLATGLGLTPAFETARMYRGPAPALDLDRIFGISTLELG